MAGKDKSEFHLDREVDALMQGAADLMGGLKDIFDRGRAEVVKAAHVGKARMDVFQLRKDRDAAVAALGAAAFELAQQGLLDHPALAEAVAAVRDLDARIGDAEREVARQEQEAASEAADEDGAESDAPGA